MEKPIQFATNKDKNVIKDFEDLNFEAESKCWYKKILILAI